MIMVTALSIPDVVAQALTIGIAGFLVKPFDIATLLNRVKRALENPENPIVQ